MTAPQYPPPDETPLPPLPDTEFSNPVMDENSPEFKEQEARATAVMEMVLPAFLDAGRAVMSENQDAVNRVANLLVSLEQSAKEAGEGPDGFWTQAAGVVRATFVDNEDAMALVKRSEELDKREGFAWKTLCVLCYLGGSMHQHALPRMAVMLHMAVAEYIYRHTVYNQAVYELRIMPWFTWFWYRTFTNARFRFYAPSLVDLDINDALKSPPGIRLQRILRAAAFGLWEPVHEKGRAWFDATEMAPNS